MIEAPAIELGQILRAAGTILVVLIQAILLYVGYGALENLVGDRAMEKIDPDD